MECVRSISENAYIHIRDGTVVAFQYQYTRERMLINTILEEEGLANKYFLAPEGLIEYQEGGIKVWTIADLLLTNKL